MKDKDDIVILNESIRLPSVRKENIEVNRKQKNESFENFLKEIEMDR